MAILEHPGVAVLYSTVIPDPAPGFPVRPPHKLPSPQASADLGQHSPALIIRYLSGVLFNTCLCHQAVNPRGSGGHLCFLHPEYPACGHQAPGKHLGTRMAARLSGDSGYKPEQSQHLLSDSAAAPRPP